MELKDVETLLAANPEAVEFIKGLGTRAALLTPEIEADLPKLGDYKAASAKVVELEKNIGTLTKEKTDLEGKLKASGKGGKGEDTPEYRALQEKIEAAGKTLEEIQGKLKTAEETATRATIEKRDTDLRSEVVTAAAKLKATDADELFILLKAKGLTGHDAAGKPFFHKLNEKGQQVAVANAEEMVAAIHATRKDLFQGSGVTGTGATHTGAGGKTETLTSTSAISRFLESRTNA